MGVTDFGAGGAANVGVARGRIEIDLQQLQRANQIVVSSARQMESALGSVGSSADRAVALQVSAWSRLKSSLSQYQVALAAAASSLTAFGVTGANNLTRLQATFRILAGSEQQAALYMQQLERMAQRTKIPFDELLEGAVSFIPAVRQTGVELSRVMEISSRLRLKDPTARLRDSVIAINELLSGAPRSLAARFEIPAQVANRLAELAEKGKTTEALDELDKYLTSIGVTSTALEELGASGVTAFSRIRSEVQLTVAQSFQPFTNALNKILNAFADIIAGVRRANSEFMSLAATVTGLVGLGTSLTTLGAISGRVPGLTGMAFMPAAMGRGATYLGVGAASVFAGAHLGKAITSEGLARVMPEEGVAGLAGKSYLEQFGLDDALNTLKQLIVVVIEQLGDVFAALVGVFDKAIEWVREALWDLTQAVMNGAQKLVDAINSVIGSLGLTDVVGTLGRISRTEPSTSEVAEELARFRERNPQFQTFDVEFEAFYQQVLQIWRDSGGEIADIIREILQPERHDRAELIQASIRAWMDQLSIQTGQALGVVERPSALPPWMEQALARKPAAPAAEAEEFVGEKELDLFRKYQEDMTRITEEEQEARVRLEQDYQLTLTREAEDEQFRRVRAIESLNRNIQQVWQQLAETQQNLTQQYQERVADLTEQYQEQELKRRQEYHRNLERLEQQHKENLIEAASRLDATAVWREQRQFERSKSELQKRFGEETEERRQAFQKQLEELRKQHETELAEAKQAAEKRVAQMREEFQLQERLQAEDRARRLARMAEDHQRQLQELTAQYTRQRNLRTQQFIDELSAATTHENLKLNIAKKGYAELETEFRNWFERQKAIITGSTAGAGGGTAITVGGGATGTTTGGSGGGTTTTGGTTGTPRFVTYLGKLIRVDRYDPAYSGGMTAAQWYSWTRLMGYQAGGFTGSGPADQIAGVVHRNEYVIPKKGAPVVFSEKLSSLMERLNTYLLRVPWGRSELRPQYPVERPSLRQLVGPITINVTGSGDPRATARLVRQEILNVFQEIGA